MYNTLHNVMYLLHSSSCRLWTRAASVSTHAAAEESAPSISIQHTSQHRDSEVFRTEKCECFRRGVKSFRFPSREPRGAFRWRGESLQQQVSAAGKACSLKFSVIQNPRVPLDSTVSPREHFHGNGVVQAVHQVHVRSRRWSVYNMEKLCIMQKHAGMKESSLHRRRQRRWAGKKWADHTIIKLFISHGCWWLTPRPNTLNIKHAGALTSFLWQLLVGSHPHSSLTCACSCFLDLFP